MTGGRFLPEHLEVIAHHLGEHALRGRLRRDGDQTENVRMGLRKSVRSGDFSRRVSRSLRLSAEDERFAWAEDC
jgi:hypothetical protein